MRYSIHVEKWPESPFDEIREHCRIFGLSGPIRTSMRPFGFESNGLAYDNRAAICDLENGDEVLIYQARIATPEMILLQFPRKISTAAAALGRLGGMKGGKSRSTAKLAAARANGKKGGRPRKPRSVAY